MVIMYNVYLWIWDNNNFQKEKNSRRNNTMYVISLTLETALKLFVSEATIEFNLGF